MSRHASTNSLSTDMFPRTSTILIARWLDQYVGLIICSLLSLMKMISGPKKKADEPVHAILVMKFWEAGCFIMAAGAFKAIKEKYPEARITVLTLDGNKEVCGMLKVFDEIIGLEIHHGVIVFLKQLLVAMMDLRHRRFDLLFDLEFLSRFSAIVTQFVRAKQSFGFFSPKRWRGYFHTDSTVFNQKVHIRDNFQSLFLMAGIEIPPDELYNIQLSFNGLDHIINTDYVVVNLNRNINLWQRSWPEDYYQELIDYLVDHSAFKIVLISLISDARKTETRYPGNVIDLCGKINFSQLAGLLKHARCFITHDSGPLHLAVALGTPTVSFFGPETPHAYGPRNPRHLVFYENMECSPCIDVFNNKKIKCCKSTNQCMWNIRVEDVIQGMKECGLIEKKEDLDEISTGI